jgi:hypothetical protein
LSLTISSVKWPIAIHSNVVEIIKNLLGKQEGISVHASTCSLFELLGNWVWDHFIKMWLNHRKDHLTFKMRWFWIPRFWGNIFKTDIHLTKKRLGQLVLKLFSNVERKTGHKDIIA